MPIEAPRRLALIIAGGTALILVAWWLMAALPAPPAPTPPSRPPPPPPVASPVAAPATPAPPPEGLRLFGLTGSGAIIGFRDGSQRLVRLGRDVMPGLTLAEVRQHNALLRSSRGDFQLDFGGVAAAPSAPGAVPAPAAQPSSEAALREETLRYRLGLAPRMAGGRVAGFTVRPRSQMPALERAGLRPGDLILRVNGSVLDEERMLELAWQIENSDRTELEFERAGRRIRATIR